MNTLIQHAKLAIRMNNNGINREFIKKISNRRNYRLL